MSIVGIVLATRGIDLGEVASAIGSASPSELVAGTLMILLTYPFLAARWRGIAADMHPPGLARMLELVLIGAAVNNAFPARLGEVARSVGLGRATSRPVLRAFGTVIVDRAADVIFCAVALGLTIGISPAPPWVRWIGWGGAIMAVACVTAVAVVSIVMRRRDGSPPRGRLTRHLAALGEGVRCVHTWPAFARAMVLTLVAWAAWMAGAGLLAHSLGIRLSFAEVLFIAAVLGLGSAVPSAPGFIGTYHWIAASALGLFGVGGTDALAFAVLLHAAWFIPTTVTGSILMVRWGLSFANLRRASIAATATGA